MSASSISVVTCYRNCDAICMEDLYVRDMMRNHHLARVISDVEFAMYVRLMKEKCKASGR